MKDLYLTHLGRSDVKQKFEYLKKLLKTDHPIIFEIGAHYGEDTLRFLDTFPECYVYAFEPSLRNIEVFSKYVGVERTTLVDKAVSNKNKKLVFYECFIEKDDYSSDFKKYWWIDPQDFIDLQLSGSGASSTKHSEKYSQNMISVDAVKLDSWMIENSLARADLMWVDVQGAEREVIEGAEKFLKNMRFVFIEYGETAYEGAMTKEETIDLLKDKGFSLIKGCSEPQGDLVFKNERY